MSLVMAWEPDGFDLVGSTWSSSTATTFRNTTYTPNITFRCRSGVSEYSVPFPSSMSDFWFTAKFYIDAMNSSESAAILRFRSGGTDQFRIYPESYPGNVAAQLRVYSYNGSTWDALGGQNDVFIMNASSTDIMLTVHVTIHGSTGRFCVYLNNDKVLDVSGDVFGTSATCDDAVLGSTRTGNTQQYWSQIAISDASLIAANVANYSPSASGTYSEWTGAYTAVDDIDNSTADTVDTNATGQRFTYNFTNTSAGQATAAGTRPIQGFGVNMRVALQAASTPTAIRAMVRTGGADYESGDKALTADDVLRPILHAWETNPNTSVAWTFSDIDNAEAGFKSV